MRVQVQDTGIGMTPEQLAQLFQRFSQADASTTRSFGGSGLGLVICKHLVELMGGFIQVHSEPGRSAAHSRSSIPLHDGAGTTAARHRAQRTVPRVGRRLGGRAKPAILVAEDNAVNQLVIRAMLERLGMTVRWWKTAPRPCRPWSRSHGTWF